MRPDRPTVGGADIVTRCAAVQLDAEGLTTPQAVLGTTARYVEDAARGGARLVVFPAHVGTLFVAASLRLPPPAPEPWPQAYAERVAETAEEWLRAARRLAAGYQVTLLPGTVIWPAALPVPGVTSARGRPHPAAPTATPTESPGNRESIRESQAAWHHAAPVVTPDGRVAHWQPQTHLLAAERRRGWTAGAELRPVDTPAGRLGVLVGTDLWYPEAARILALQDAVVLACPVAVPHPYRIEHQLRGLWQQVQQNQVFGVEAGLGGAALGERWQPRTAAAAPVEMTAGETGWLGRLSAEGSGLLAAEMDFAALQEVVRVYDIFAQINPVLYARHLPAVYEGWRGMDKESRGGHEGSRGGYEESRGER